MSQRCRGALTDERQALHAFSPRHAVGSTFFTRNDRGGHRFNYSQILGDLSAAALAEAYHPARERGASVFLINGFGAIGGDMVDNLLREFVFNKLTRRAKGQGKP